MSVKVVQVPPVDVWPSGDGWTIGILARETWELAERLGIEFESGLDDLGTYRLAAISEPQIGQFWLFAHEATEQVGTDVVVDRAIPRDIGLSSVWRALRLDIRSFDWVSPYSACPAEDPALDNSHMTKPRRRLGSWLSGVDLREEPTPPGDNRPRRRSQVQGRLNKN